MTEQTITKANDDITMDDDQTNEMDGQTEEADDFTIDTSQVHEQRAAEKPANWRRYLGPFKFAVRGTPQNSTDFIPCELDYGHKVRTPKTLLKRIWTDEDEDREVKSACQPEVDLKQRIEEKPDKKELKKIQTRNQSNYDVKTRQRKVQIIDSVLLLLLLLLLTEFNKPTLVWQGPHNTVGVVGEVDYRIEVASGGQKLTT